MARRRKHHPQFCKAVCPFHGERCGSLVHDGLHKHRGCIFTNADVERAAALQKKAWRRPEAGVQA